MKKKQIVEEPETIIDKIIRLFDTYLDTTNAIVEDYVGGPGMTMELEVANKNLRAAILLLDEGEMTFEKLLEKIKELNCKEIKPEDLIQVAVDAYDFEAEHLIKHLDSSDLGSFATSNDYCLIKVPNMNHRDKLEAFITSEIYPNVNEQNEFLII